MSAVQEAGVVRKLCMGVRVTAGASAMAGATSNSKGGREGVYEKTDKMSAKFALLQLQS